MLGWCGLLNEYEPDVVGSLTQCEKGWCLFDVTGRRGYISTDDVWGDEPLK